MLTPAYCDTQITSPVTVNVVVTFGNGRDAKSSDPIEFTYKPKPNLQVQEVEMHPAMPLPTENFIPVDIFGEVVMNNLPQQVLEPPAPVVLPLVNEEQGELKLALMYITM